jgi:hypothetical protein
MLHTHGKRGDRAYFLTLNRFLFQRVERFISYLVTRSLDGDIPGDFSQRLCVKVVVIRLENGLTKYPSFLLSALVKRSQITLHTASQANTSA